MEQGRIAKTEKACLPLSYKFGKRTRKGEEAHGHGEGVENNPASKLNWRQFRSLANEIGTIGGRSLTMLPFWFVVPLWAVFSPKTHRRESEHRDFDQCFRKLQSC